MSLSYREWEGPVGACCWAERMSPVVDRRHCSLREKEEDRCCQPYCPPSPPSSFQPLLPEAPGPWLVMACISQESVRSSLSVCTPFSVDSEIYQQV